MKPSLYSVGRVRYIGNSFTIAGVSQLHASAVREPEQIKPDVRELSLDELEAIVLDAGERSFRARQIMGWVWSRGVESFDAMHDLPAAFREYLKDRFHIGTSPQVHVERSIDG